MAKALRHRLKFWRQKDREPGDVSHHFRGPRCISECELYVKNQPLLRAIVYEWLVRNPGIRTIEELANALDIHTYWPLDAVLRLLASERKIALSEKYGMLTSDWTATITVNEWLRRAGLAQEEQCQTSRSPRKKRRP